MYYPKGLVQLTDPRTHAAAEEGAEAGVLVRVGAGLDWPAKKTDARGPSTPILQNDAMASTRASAVLHAMRHKQAVGGAGGAAADAEVEAGAGGAVAAAAPHAMPATQTQARVWRAHAMGATRAMREADLVGGRIQHVEGPSPASHVPCSSHGLASTATPHRPKVLSATDGCANDAHTWSE